MFMAVVSLMTDWGQSIQIELRRVDRATSDCVASHKSSYV